MRFGAIADWQSVGISAVRSKLRDNSGYDLLLSQFLNRAPIRILLGMRSGTEVRGIGVAWVLRRRHAVLIVGETPNTSLLGVHINDTQQRDFCQPLTRPESRQLFATVGIADRAREHTAKRFETRLIQSRTSR